MATRLPTRGLCQRGLLSPPPLLPKLRLTLSCQSAKPRLAAPISPCLKPLPLQRGVRSVAGVLVLSGDSSLYFSESWWGLLGSVPNAKSASVDLSCSASSHPTLAAPHIPGFRSPQEHAGAPGHTVCVHCFLCCSFSLQSVTVLVTQSCLTLCNPKDCSPSMEFSRQDCWSG